MYLSTSKEVEGNLSPGITRLHHQFPRSEMSQSARILSSISVAGAARLTYAVLLPLEPQDTTEITTVSSLPNKPSRLVQGWQSHLVAASLSTQGLYLSGTSHQLSVPELPRSSCSLEIRIEDSWRDFLPILLDGKAWMTLLGLSGPLPVTCVITSPLGRGLKRDLALDMPLATISLNILGIGGSPQLFKGHSTQWTLALEELILCLCFPSLQELNPGQVTLSSLLQDPYPTCPPRAVSLELVRKVLSVLKLQCPASQFLQGEQGFPDWYLLVYTPEKLHLSWLYARDLLQRVLVQSQPKEASLTATSSLVERLLDSSDSASLCPAKSQSLLCLLHSMALPLAAMVQSRLLNPPWRIDQGSIPILIESRETGEDSCPELSPEACNHFHTLSSRSKFSRPFYEPLLSSLKKEWRIARTYLLEEALIPTDQKFHLRCNSLGELKYILPLEGGDYVPVV